MMVLVAVRFLVLVVLAGERVVLRLVFSMAVYVIVGVPVGAECCCCGGSERDIWDGEFDCVRRRKFY